MIFRKFKETDTISFFEYLQSLSHETLEFFTPNDLSMDAAKELTSKEATENNSIINYGAFDGKIMAGYCFYKFFDKDVPILAIGITDQYQNQGIGRKFLTFALNEAKNSGKKGIRLTTFKENFRAQHLYRSIGFIDTGDKNAPEGEIELFYMFNNNPVPSTWKEGVCTYETD